MMKLVVREPEMAMVDRDQEMEKTDGEYPPVWNFALITILLLLVTGVVSVMVQWLS